MAGTSENLSRISRFLTSRNAKLGESINQRVVSVDNPTVAALNGMNRIETPPQVCRQWCNRGITPFRFLRGRF